MLVDLRTILRRYASFLNIDYFLFFSMTSYVADTTTRKGKIVSPHLYELKFQSFIRKLFKKIVRLIKRPKNSTLILLYFSPTWNITVVNTREWCTVFAVRFQMILSLLQQISIRSSSAPICQGLFLIEIRQINNSSRSSMRM